MGLCRLLCSFLTFMSSSALMWRHKGASADLAASGELLCLLHDCPADFSHTSLLEPQTYIPDAGTWLSSTWIPLRCSVAKRWTPWRNQGNVSARRICFSQGTVSFILVMSNIHVCCLVFKLFQETEASLVPVTASLPKVDSFSWFNIKFILGLNFLPLSKAYHTDDIACIYEFLNP